MTRKKRTRTTSELIAEMETDELGQDEIARRFGISVAQLQTYVKENRTDIDYHKSRLLGRREEWLEALGRRAVGYDYKERKVTTTEQNGKRKTFTEISERHLPPDTQALVWLLEHSRE